MTATGWIALPSPATDTQPRVRTPHARWAQVHIRPWHRTRGGLIGPRACPNQPDAHFLLATKVEDRFGNSVHYVYNADAIRRLSGLYRSLSGARDQHRVYGHWMHRRAHLLGDSAWSNLEFRVRRVRSTEQGLQTAIDGHRASVLAVSIHGKSQRRLSGLDGNAGPNCEVAPEMGRMVPADCHPPVQCQGEFHFD